jgi:hypothetical protein
MYKIHLVPHRNSLSRLQDGLFMTHEEIIDVYCENHMEPINRL